MLRIGESQLVFDDFTIPLILFIGRKASVENMHITTDDQFYNMLSRVGLL